MELFQIMQMSKRSCFWLQNSVFDIGNCTVIHCDAGGVSPVTDADKSWPDYSALNQIWSYPPTFRDTD